MRAYRVFSYVKNAAQRDPGGVFFTPPQGAGRIDNPDLYDILYVADHAAAAVAETLTPVAHRWTERTLRGDSRIVKSARALAVLEIPDSPPICDLNDTQELSNRSLQPANVITRHYVETQLMARSIYNENRYRGLKWWSYYEASWASVGLWHFDDVTCADIIPLTLRHPAVTEAARVAGCQIALPKY